MLQDYFFDAYMGTSKAQPAAPAPDIPVKDTYSRAEVDEIISMKLEEAVKQISGKDVQVAPVLDPEDAPTILEDLGQPRTTSDK